MSDLTRAIRDLRDAMNILELVMADSEPAPFSVVLVKDRSSGRIHRRGRIEGIEGWMTYEGDNADAAGAFDIIPDLSRLSDESQLCLRCFGPTDEGPEG